MNCGYPPKVPFRSSLIVHIVFTPGSYLKFQKRRASYCMFRKITPSRNTYAVIAQGKPQRGTLLS